MNERIVATALYYLDSENVTPSHLSFRMRTSTEQDELSYRTGQDMWGVYEHFYGTRLRDSDSESVQPYGDVETREGRLLAFPNVLYVLFSLLLFSTPSTSSSIRSSSWSYPN